MDASISYIFASFHFYISSPDNNLKNIKNSKKKSNLLLLIKSCKTKYILYVHVGRLFRGEEGHSKVNVGRHEGGGVKNGQKSATLFMDGPIKKSKTVKFTKTT